MVPDVNPVNERLTDKGSVLETVTKPLAGVVAVTSVYEERLALVPY